MYSALVCRINSITSIPGRSKIVSAEVSGHTVIVGTEQKVGDLGVFFPPDGKLSDKMLHYNDLYREGHGINLTPGKFGYFDHNGRVRTIRMAGQNSEGVWFPLQVLNWTGVNLDALSEGTEIRELNGHLICEKYYSPFQQRAMTKAKNEGIRYREINLPRHYDTEQLRYNLHRIPEGTPYTITEKLHGTSGRTGYIQIPTNLNWLQRKLNQLVGWFGWSCFPTTEWRVVSGSRNINFDPDKVPFNVNDFRYQINKRFEKAGLPPNYVVYYEIVGTDHEGKSIMPSHNCSVHPELKQYGDRMQYRYGTDNNYEVYVYRINDNGYEEHPSLVKAEAEEMGFKSVPILAEGVFTTPQALIDECRRLADGPSTLDPSHIREGIVVRIGDKAFKWKGFWFSTLEGICKNDDQYCDPEEIA